MASNNRRCRDQWDQPARDRWRLTCSRKNAERIRMSTVPSKGPERVAFYEVHVPVWTGVATQIGLVARSAPIWPVRPPVGTAPSKSISRPRKPARRRRRRTTKALAILSNAGSAAIDKIKGKAKQVGGRACIRSRKFRRRRSPARAARSGSLTSSRARHPSPGSSRSPGKTRIPKALRASCIKSTGARTRPANSPTSAAAARRVRRQHAAGRFEPGVVPGPGRPLD